MELLIVQVWDFRLANNRTKDNYFDYLEIVNLTKYVELYSRAELFNLTPFGIMQR